MRAQARGTGHALSADFNIAIGERAVGGGGSAAFGLQRHAGSEVGIAGTATGLGGGRVGCGGGAGTTVITRAVRAITAATAITTTKPARHADRLRAVTHRIADVFNCQGIGC